MKTKSKSKFILFIGLFLISLFIISINNTVSAEEVNIDVFVNNEIAEDFIDKKDISIWKNDNTNDISIYLNNEKAWKVSKNVSKLDKLIRSDNYVYESLYIELEDGIDGVKIKENNQNLEIIKKDNKNYIKYDVKIFKKENGKYIPCGLRGHKFENVKSKDDITMQYMKNSEIIKEQKCSIGSSVVGFEDDSAEVLFSIVDENGNIAKGCIGVQGDPGWVSRSCSTAYDYNGCYYELLVKIYAGDSLNVGEFGTFEYGGEKDITRRWNGEFFCV